MLPSLPLLRDVLRSDLFPELLNHKVVKPIFAVVVALLFLGPQVGVQQAVQWITDRCYLCKTMHTWWYCISLKHSRCIAIVCTLVSANMQL
jgi:hypothetical protein